MRKSSIVTSKTQYIRELLVKGKTEEALKELIVFLENNKLNANLAWQRLSEYKRLSKEYYQKRVLTREAFLAEENQIVDAIFKILEENDIDTIVASKAKEPERNRTWLLLFVLLLLGTVFCTQQFFCREKNTEQATISVPNEDSLSQETVDSSNIELPQERIKREPEKSKSISNTPIHSTTKKISSKPTDTISKSIEIPKTLLLKDTIQADITNRKSIEKESEDNKIVKKVYIGVSNKNLEAINAAVYINKEFKNLQITGEKVCLSSVQLDAILYLPDDAL